MTGTYGFTALHHVLLAVPPGSEDTCRAFWSGVLGMIEIEKPPALARRGGCWFRAGAIEIHLGVDPDFQPLRKGHPGILVSGVRTLAAHLEGAGVPVRWNDDFPAYDRFYSTDPFGNRLEFMQPR
jgi:catechol 2,3-dioxygenase-like lactoylglutathione lyase family enzyme